MMHPSENPQGLLFREEQAFHRNQKTADDAPGMAGSPETDGCVYRGNATAPDLRRPSNGLLHKSKRCMARAMAALPDSAPGFGERCRLLFCSAFLSNSRRSAYRLPPKNTGAAPPHRGQAPRPCRVAMRRSGHVGIVDDFAGGGVTGVMLHKIPEHLAVLGVAQGTWAR